MTKQEFDRRIERARRLLVLCSGNEGVCDILNEAFGLPYLTSRACEAFENFRPMLYEHSYWLRDSVNRNDNMTQLERRLVFLESFKGFCDAYKLYESW